jgi:alpha-beta hydrolase superfamily lysophospholipase
MVRMRGGSAKLAEKGGDTMRMAVLSLAATMLLAGSALAQERTRSLVKYDTVEIDVIAEGKGPLIVLLPSRGRDSEDYDEVAAGLAKAGFRVLRTAQRHHAA